MLMEREKIKTYFAELRNDETYDFLIDGLNQKYNQIKDMDIPALPFDSFKRVYEDGDRKSYETPYFMRRIQMNVNALMAMIYPQNTEYLDKLQSIIWEICNEYYWGLPYHIEFDKNESEFIDLYAAETGCALAEIMWVLEDELCPHIKARINAELERRIFKPFVNRKFWWFEAVHNWSAVCATNVAVAMMRIKPQLFVELKPKFDEIMDCFLSGYGNDGMCKEGINYWYYGFGNFAFYADMILEFSDGKDNYFENKKIKEIALFRNKALLGETCCVSFSDGPVKTKTDLAMYALLYEKYPHMLQPPNRDKSFIGYDHWIDFFRAFIYFKEYPENNLNGTLTDCVLYQQGSEQYIKKTSEYAFAVKAGNNDEPHNHNDVGSFIVAKDDAQVLCDIGAGLYTRQYFDEETRYSIFCNSSLSHNVPIVCKKAQSTGTEFCGELSVDGNTVKINFAKAYDVGGLTKLERVFELKETEITLTDTFNVGEICERFVSYDDFQVSECGVVEVRGVKMKYDSNKWSVSLKTHSHINSRGETVTIHICDFDPKSDNEQYFRLNIIF